MLAGRLLRRQIWPPKLRLHASLFLASLVGASCSHAVKIESPWTTVRDTDSNGNPTTTTGARSYPSGKAELTLIASCAYDTSRNSYQPRVFFFGIADPDVVPSTLSATATFEPMRRIPLRLAPDRLNDEPGLAVSGEEAADLLRAIAYGGKKLVLSWRTRDGAEHEAAFDIARSRASLRDVAIQCGKIFA